MRGGGDGRGIALLDLLLYSGLEEEEKGRGALEVKALNNL
jgi:hypothetical protein